jgi:hypothetical protein
MLSETVVYILSFIIYVGIGTILIHIGVSFAGAKDTSLKKAFIVALVGAIISTLFGWLPLIGIGVLFVALVVVIRIAYMTEWPKAFLACVTYIVGIWIIGFFLGLLGG